MQIEAVTQEAMASCASVDITPTKPVPLAGYGERTGVFEGIADPLEANVMTYRHGGKEVTLVAADLLYCGDELRTALQERLGMTASPECLFLSASHTHSAPMTQFGTPSIGVPDSNYVEFVAERITGAINSARQSFAPAAVTYHRGVADHSMNRRLKRVRIGRNGAGYRSDMGPNPEGERDEQISSLRISSKEGTLRAVIWSYACHPAISPEFNMVSADYPGVVRQRLRQVYGKIPVLFLQGFSGDLRPPFRARVNGLKPLVLRICHGPRFGRPSLREWESWASSLSDCVQQALDAEGIKVAGGPLSTSRQTVVWPGVRWSSSRHRDLTFHVIALGEVALVGIGAEVVARYRDVAEKIFAGYKIFPVGCIDQIWAYLPADQMISEGGYEVGDFAPLFDFPGRYEGGLEREFAAGLARLRNDLTN